MRRAVLSGALSLSNNIPDWLMLTAAGRLEEAYELAAAPNDFPEIGRDIPLDELRARHDAVLVATGVCEARHLARPGIGLVNIVPAMASLTAANRKGLGDTMAECDNGALDARGKRVAVIGGGDTARDCVRTAVRQGAKSVRRLYRRDRANTPGSVRAVRHAAAAGSNSSGCRNRSPSMARAGGN